ncbi:enolase-phosphatase E1 [Saccharata proteae CBS 121410]|uniref:Enolase-phosphatase E1 n=1 Tax=Saccharata proteae CBS 121410 TaxID=1314787 RepID=A0A9P4HQC7_9PEZI|nr:enolase-phosphatase E1 [Saccharata proteae CBS 121410]
MAQQDLSQISLVLLDIEGTVCSISFVRERLFPYAIEVLPETAAKSWDDPEFRTYVSAFPAEAQASPTTFADHAVDLMKQDSKAPYLKKLQGYLWKTGWTTGAFLAPLYPDVLPTLRTWHSSPTSLAIFSSGSVDAQKLLFSHVGVASASGDNVQSPASPTGEDVNHLFTAYFDTQNAGPKTDRASYSKIAEAVGKAVSEVLFLSDNVREVRAALAAGMKAMVIDRPGNEPLSAADREELFVRTSFADIALLG